MNYNRLIFTYFLLSFVRSETLTTHNVMKIKSNSENGTGTDDFRIQNGKFNHSTGQFRKSHHNKLEQPDEDSDKRTFFPPDLHRVVMAIDVLPSGLCKNDSREVLEAVISREQWALKMFDSSPKFPVGMLYGSYYQLGNFDECVSIKQALPLTNRIIQGQYCLADIALNSNKGNDERVARSNSHFHVHGPQPRIAFNNTLHWAICVPSSCRAEEVELFLEELFKIAISYKAVTIQIEERKCHYEKTVPYSNVEIIYGSLAGFFLVFVLLASIYHLIRLYHKTKSLNYSVNAHQNTRPKIYHELILSFSLIRNVGKLLGHKSSDLNLDCISGIRFISMLFIVCSHTLLFLVGGPVLNEEFYSEAVKKPKNAMWLNNPLYVDTFLLLSGFLMCRLFLLELEKRNGKINLLALYIGRYIRLTPSYFMVIALYCTLLIRIDNGPRWGDIMSTEQDRCLKSWWTNILYINNYVHTDNICMFQSWYLSVDTHLFVIAPFIIYPLWKWPRAGEILLGIVTLVAAFVPFMITYMYELDPTLMAYPSEISDITTNSYFAFAYIKTHMRATSYCIGLIAGYIVHKLQASNTKLSSKVVRISWSLATIFGVSTVFSITIFYLPEHSYNVLEAAAFSSLHKIAWSVSIGWIIIACVTDNSGPVKRFLSWRPFIPLGRLTYCAFLVNGLIELHSSGTIRTPTYMSVLSIAYTSLGHLVLTFVAGFMLCVLFESPIHSIEKIILSAEHSQKNRQQPQQQITIDNAKL